MEENTYETSAMFIHLFYDLVGGLEHVSFSQIYDIYIYIDMSDYSHVPER